MLEQAGVYNSFAIARHRLSLKKRTPVTDLCPWFGLQLDEAKKQLDARQKARAREEGRLRTALTDLAAQAVSDAQQVVSAQEAHQELLKNLPEYISPAAQTPKRPPKHKLVPNPPVRQLHPPFLEASPPTKGPGVLAPTQKLTSPAAAAHVNKSLRQQVLPCLAPQPRAFFSQPGLHTAQQNIAPNVPPAPLAGQQLLAKQATWHQAFLQQEPSCRYPAPAAVKQQAQLGRLSQDAHAQGMAGSSAAQADWCQQNTAGSQQGQSQPLPKQCKMSSPSKTAGCLPSPIARSLTAHVVTQGRAGASSTAVKPMLQGSVMTQHPVPMSRQSPRPPTSWSRSTTAQTACQQPAANSQLFPSAQASHSGTDASVSAQYGRTLPPAALRASTSPQGAQRNQAAAVGQKGPVLMQAQVPGSKYCWPLQSLPASAKYSAFQPEAASMSAFAPTDSAAPSPVPVAAPSAAPFSAPSSAASSAPSATPSAYLGFPRQAARTATAHQCVDISPPQSRSDCQPPPQASFSQSQSLTCAHSPALQTASQQLAAGTPCKPLPSAAIHHSLADCLVETQHEGPGLQAAPPQVVAAQTSPWQAPAAQTSAAAKSSRAAARSASRAEVSDARASAVYGPAAPGSAAPRSAAPGSAAQGSAARGPAAQSSAAQDSATQGSAAQGPASQGLAPNASAANHAATQATLPPAPRVSSSVAQALASQGLPAQSPATLSSINKVLVSSSPVHAHHQQDPSVKLGAAHPPLQRLAPQLLALFSQSPACAPKSAGSELTDTRPPGAQVGMQLPKQHAPRQARGLQSCTKPIDRHQAECQLGVPMPLMAKCQKRQGMVEATGKEPLPTGDRPAIVALLPCL